MPKTDPAHRETDKLLAKMEAEIKSVYTQAYKEAKQTADDFMKQFQQADKKKREAMLNGEIDKEEYARWRRTQLFQGKRYQRMADTLAADMTSSKQIAASVINGHLPEVYALNHNYGTYEMEHGGRVDTQYTLYDRQTVERLLREDPDLLPHARVDIPADIKWNKQTINSAITQGILQGEEIDKIASRLAHTVTDMSRTSAIRNARTMTTSAENGGRIDSYKRAEKMGIKMLQVWMATLDDRTRHEHRQLDGQKRKVGEPFEVDGYKIEFPADPKAEPHLVYNCRCTLIGQVEGVNFDLSDVTQRDNKLGDKTYEEWKEEKREEKEDKQVDPAPSGKAVEIEIPGKNVLKAIDNSVENGIIKSVRIDYLAQSIPNEDITPECMNIIINTLKEHDVLYLYDDIKIVNIPYDEELRIEPLRTNAISSPGYPKVVLEINKAFFGGLSKEEIDYLLITQNYCVANSLEELILHEIAHAKVIDGITYARYEAIDEELKGEIFTKSDGNKPSLKELAKDISKYAQKDGLECIAECHVKLLRGEIIHERLKNLHDRYI